MRFRLMILALFLYLLLTSVHSRAAEVEALTVHVKEAVASDFAVPQTPKEQYVAQMNALEDLLVSNSRRQLNGMKRLDELHVEDDEKIEVCKELCSLWEAELGLYLKQIEAMYQYTEALEKLQKASFSKKRQQEIINLSKRIDNLFRFIQLNIELGPPPGKIVV